MIKTQNQSMKFPVFFPGKLMEMNQHLNWLLYCHQSKILIIGLYIRLGSLRNYKISIEIKNPKQILNYFQVQFNLKFQQLYQNAHLI